MSKHIHHLEFDTISEAKKFVKDFIESKINQQNKYPYYVTNKYQGYGKFVIEYTC